MAPTTLVCFPSNFRPRRFCVKLTAGVDAAVGAAAGGDSVGVDAEAVAVGEASARRGGVGEASGRLRGGVDASGVRQRRAGAREDGGPEGGGHVRDHHRAVRCTLLCDEEGCESEIRKPALR